MQFKSLAFAAISVALMAESNAMRIPAAERRQVGGGIAGSASVGDVSGAASGTAAIDGSTATLGAGGVLALPTAAPGFEGGLPGLPSLPGLPGLPAFPIPTASASSISASLTSALGSLPTGSAGAFGVDTFESFVEEVAADVYAALTGATDYIPAVPTTNDVGNTGDEYLTPLIALAGIFNSTLSTLLGSYDLNGLPTGTLVPIPDLPSLPGVPDLSGSVPDVSDSADGSASASASGSFSGGLTGTVARLANVQAAKSRYFDALPFSLPALLAIFNDAFETVSAYAPTGYLPIAAPTL